MFGGERSYLKRIRGYNTGDDGGITLVLKFMMTNEFYYVQTA